MRQERYDRLKKMYDSKHFEDVCADAIEAVNAEKKIWIYIISESVNCWKQYIFLEHVTRKRICRYLLTIVLEYDILQLTKLTKITKLTVISRLTERH